VLIRLGFRIQTKSIRFNRTAEDYTRSFIGDCNRTVRRVTRQRERERERAPHVARPKRCSITLYNWYTARCYSAIRSRVRQCTVNVSRNAIAVYSRVGRIARHCRAIVVASVLFRTRGLVWFSFFASEILTRTRWKWLRSGVFVLSSAGQSRENDSQRAFDITRRRNGNATNKRPHARVIYNRDLFERERKQMAVVRAQSIVFLFSFFCFFTDYDGQRTTAGVRSLSSSCLHVLVASRRYV